MEIFHTIGVMLNLWMRVGWGAGIHFSRSLNYILSFPGAWTFRWIQSFLLGFCKINESHKFHVLGLLLRDWMCNWSLGSGKKVVVCIVYFAYSVIVIIIITIFLCSFVKLSLYQPMSFTFCPFVLPVPLGGGRGEWARGCLALSCWLLG